MTDSTPTAHAAPAVRLRRAALGAALLIATTGGRGVAAELASESIRTLARVDTTEADAQSIYLVLRLAERRLHVMQGDEDGGRDRRLESFPVAIGRAEYATPTGRFRVREKLVDPDFVTFDWQDPSRVIGRVAPGPENPLGARWIGFTTAYGWTIGFHGTPQPELLGQAVSHGCVRMRNSDVVKLYRRVDIGTPVIVEP
jgi:lipoprotein-anchoring transpeptidase ErfK/SrfK